MVVLIVNAGSSSLHLAYVDGATVRGRLDRHDRPGSPEAAEALRAFLDANPAPDAVGHRLVHGGRIVLRPTVVDPALRRALDGVADLAPLHVPPSLSLLDQVWAQLPDVPHVLCPDTAFHAGMPEAATTLPVPREWRERWGLRRYGFHGLSYAYATRRAAELLGRPAAELRLVLAHLGGGASVCAVLSGRSVYTSMGFTPLDGVPMATRSGAVDPGMLLWLLGEGRLGRDEVLDGLYRRSGLLGVSDGCSDDTRVLVEAAPREPAAALALDVFNQAVRQQVAAVATALDRLDAVVFTGEIGWDQPEVRRDVCAGLHLLGVPRVGLSQPERDAVISPPDAGVAVLAIEPREDLQIAAETRAALG